MKPTVLVVEDNPVLIELYDAVLSDDYAVHCALNLEQAMQVISHEKVDVLALDYYLGNVLGLDLLEWVQKHHPYLLPHCVILSGDPTPEMRGFKVPVMCKPVDMDVLIRLIGRMATSASSLEGAHSR